MLRYVLLTISPWNLFWEWAFCILQLKSLKNNYEEIKVFDCKFHQANFRTATFKNICFSKHLQWLLSVFYNACIKMLFSSIIKSVNIARNILPSSQVLVHWALVCLKFRSGSVMLCHSTCLSTTYLSFFTWQMLCKTQDAIMTELTLLNLSSRHFRRHLNHPFREPKAFSSVTHAENNFLLNFFWASLNRFMKE